MRLGTILFSNLAKQRLLYSAYGITQQGVRVSLSNHRLERGEVLEVGEDACFVTPYTEGHQVFGRCTN